MICCVDVHYRGRVATAAALVTTGWADAEPAASYVTSCDVAGEYESGSFYKRELPPLLQVLSAVSCPLEAVLVDGYVWLGEGNEPGLGARLYDALERRVAVVGVAKRPYRGSGFARAVLRRNSKRPLYVTAAGMDVEKAVELVRSMHGEHRIPTLLKEVDALSRR